MAHGVGAGKTAAMIIAAHETRRTGRIDGTTVFAVPGNMVEQFARDYLRLYPAARVLTPTGKTQRDAVREFAARVATGDFDAAICSHNHLKTIPLSPDVERDGAAASPRRLHRSTPTETLSRAAARRWAKTMEKQTARLEGAPRRRRGPRRHLLRPDGRRHVGRRRSPPGEEHRAADEPPGPADCRTDPSSPKPSSPAPTGSASAHGDAAVVMATATPVTNSPAEMWVNARLVAPRRPRHAPGSSTSTRSRRTSSHPVETVEHTADDKLKVVTRLGEYKNFPDLARLFRSFTDVRRTDSLGFQLPDLDSGRPHVHVTPPTEQQLTAAAWAAERATQQHISLARRRRPTR